MKKLKIIILIALIVVTAFAIVSVSKSKAAGTFTNRSVLNAAPASTTVVYMTPGTASSTITFSTEDSDLNQIFIQYIASTSASILHWTYEFSNDGIDWFGEDAISITRTDSTPANYHSSTTINHIWNAGSSVSSTTRKMVTLPSIASTRARVTFTLPIGTANGALYVERMTRQIAN